MSMGNQYFGSGRWFIDRLGLEMCTGLTLVMVNFKCYFGFFSDNRSCFLLRPSLTNSSDQSCTRYSFPPSHHIFWFQMSGNITRIGGRWSGAAVHGCPVGEAVQATVVKAKHDHENVITDFKSCILYSFITRVLMLVLSR
jgi:hypothetical protein